MKVPLYQTCRSSKVRETKKSLSVQLEEFWLVCLAELEEVSISLRLGAGELELIRTLGFTTRIALSFTKVASLAHKLMTVITDS